MSAKWSNVTNILQVGWNHQPVVYQRVRGSAIIFGIQDASAPSYFATTLAVTIFLRRGTPGKPIGHLFT